MELGLGTAFRATLHAVQPDSEFHQSFLAPSFRQYYFLPA
jgi:hypothetical protein